MVSETGMADLATAGIMLAAWCLKSQQMRCQGPKFRNFPCFAQIISCWGGVSLITGLEWTIEFLGKANLSEATLHTCSCFFNPFHSFIPQKSLLCCR